MLHNARVLVGISGGIAAYKSAHLVRLLKKAGAEVRVVMTQGAQAFIQPLTLQALSGNPVATDLLDPAAEAGMGHIELARWPTHIVLAPATANLIARLNAGMADELLPTLILATNKPVFIAPAMNQQMWQAPVTQANIKNLQAMYPSWQWLGPDAGEQACGEVGAGRMLEPEAIVEALQPAQKLAGKHLLITSGPTREALDPVRFISNHSSGKMGNALASAALRLGAKVTMITGPGHLPVPAGVQQVAITSALNMLQAVQDKLASCDWFIGCAAVADYRPAEVSEQKLKKGAEDELSLQLVKNPDIIATVGQHPQRPSLVVGFAAESEALLQYGEQKLKRKGLDWIVCNDISQPGIAMNADDNAVTIIGHSSQKVLSQASKQKIGQQIIDFLIEQTL
ncbi:bifunctional phosphopantothenoylcysteine decarboxylase/phosphopantothenate--cysteine ligase CoaBC [Salinibius halmophilus]|uniref:bifunctional phosphopantothenoylcysteine decarboxylase/phosphopantothenate--cysteine ligase CoaBC n=1 Tax=Salinibius halmophilus TaxID=1853216 RepID=UPI000E668636|nr:bifunctional phosphopantothenoylcysteine decarboxylase/phosphopantothenate--cysteine ligase CoaBC [Salinibius halmophilus]